MKEFLATLTYVAGVATVHLVALLGGGPNALNGVLFFWGVDLVLIGTKYILGIYPKKEELAFTWWAVVLNLAFQGIRAVIAINIMMG